MKTTTYNNSFYTPNTKGSTKTFTVNVKPVSYKGHLIFHRIKATSAGADVFDIVKDGWCIHMASGLNGAKRIIDDDGVRITEADKKSFKWGLDMSIKVNRKLIW